MNQKMKYLLLVTTLGLVGCYDYSNLAPVEEIYKWPEVMVTNTYGPDSLNAAHLYLSAENAYSLENEDAGLITAHFFRDTSVFSKHEIKSWIDQNQEAITIFKEGSKQSFCDFSFGEKPYIQPTSEKWRIFPELYMLSKLLLIQGWMQDQENNHEDALESYIAVLNFAHHLDTQWKSVGVSKLLEVIIVNQTMEALVQHIELIDLGSRQHFTTIIETLEKYANTRNNMGAMFHHLEYSQRRDSSQVETLRNDYTEKMLSNPLIDPTEADLLFNYYYSVYEQELLKGHQVYYASLMDGVERNDFSSVISYTQSEIDKLRSEMKLKFTDRLKPVEARLARLAVVWARIELSKKNDYRDWIQGFYATEVQLDILRFVVAAKLGLDLHLLLDNSQDPFNEFKPYNSIETDTTLVLYSYGANKFDDKGSKLMFRYSEEFLQDSDLGLKFRLTSTL